MFHKKRDFDTKFKKRFRFTVNIIRWRYPITILYLYKELGTLFRGIFELKLLPFKELETKMRNITFFALCIVLVFAMVFVSVTVAAPGKQLDGNYSITVCF